MVHQKLRRQNSGLPRMESVARFGSIPVVDTGIKTAGNVYQRVKVSNNLLCWGFETVEGTALSLIDSLRPAVKLIQGPLHKLDMIMCYSLDLVEQKVPSVYLPPQMMYWNTKEYMSNRLVRPVIKRANSVKKMGHVVLDNRVSNYAAGRLDGVINVADKYVEKYLPPGETQDQADNSTTIQNDENESQTVQAIHKGRRFSKKLKRRLTMRTIQELTALKKQSTEAVHVVIYAAEMIATNPKMALQKAMELWSYLSADEPENQARPHTLEQLVVLLTRESARRIIHLINFTASSISKVPKTVKMQTREIVHQFIHATDTLIKAVKLEKAKNLTIEEANNIVHKIQSTYDELQNQTNIALERLAIFLSGRLEAEKITTSPRRQLHNRINHNPMYANINGVYL